MGNPLASEGLIDQLDMMAQTQFNGRLDVQATTGQMWSVYFCLGRLVWATGGLRPTQRWYRQVMRYGSNLTAIQPTDNSRRWDYNLLIALVKRQLLKREQAVALIDAILTEIFFDMLQQEDILQLDVDPFIFTPNKQDVVESPLTVISLDQLRQHAEQAWQAWRNAGLADRSPNLTPVIKQSDQLRQEVAPAVFNTLVKVIDGKHTLRDLAVLMKQDPLPLARSLMPFVSKGLIALVELVEVQAANPTTDAYRMQSGTDAYRTGFSDAQRGVTDAQRGLLSDKGSMTGAQRGLPAMPAAAQSQQANGPLIACIDDSPLVCQALEQILIQAKYRFVGIGDPLMALPTLLERKPDLIFLDLIMPVANGYEICSQIRRISAFKNIPIVILTGNDGIVDRVRAKVVGSSDFMSKPVEAARVLSMIQKHLPTQKLDAKNPASSGGQSGLSAEVNQQQAIWVN